MEGLVASSSAISPFFSSRLNSESQASRSSAGPGKGKHKDTRPWHKQGRNSFGKFHWEDATDQTRWSEQGKKEEGIVGL